LGGGERVWLRLRVLAAGGPLRTGATENKAGRR